MSRNVAALVVVFFAGMPLCLAACGSVGMSPDTTGAGTADAGVTDDGAAADAGSTEDTGVVADAGGDAGTGLPRALPFEFTRADVGEPLTPAEITAFTKKITGFWKQTDFFKWVVRTSHGEDASTGRPDFMVWWTGVEAVKAGDLVTFLHSPNGGPDNIMIPTSRMLAQAIGAYLLTGDAAAGTVVEQFSKGQIGTIMGMVWDASDTIPPYIMARAVMTHNHEFTIEGGKRKAVDYTAWRHPTVDWNTHTIEVKDNPYWGDIWVKNMRSKDDVPHIFRTAAWLRYVAEDGKDAAVREAAARNYEYLTGMAKDIVDNGYHIRSKNEDGEVYSPTEDLASFVQFDWIDPNAECDAKLVFDLMATGTAKNNCDKGFGGGYEDAAMSQHYYEAAIIRGFHAGVVLHAIVGGKLKMASLLLQGLAERLDKDLAVPENKVVDQFHTTKAEWERDLALLALQGGAEGLPITSREVRLMQEYYAKTVDRMLAWDKWDLWSPAIPDGTHEYRPPGDSGFVDVEDMAWFLELCWSPLRNPSTRMPVDCEIVKDPAKWGE